MNPGPTCLRREVTADIPQGCMSRGCGTSAGPIVATRTDAARPSSLPTTGPASAASILDGVGEDTELPTGKERPLLEWPQAGGDRKVGLRLLVAPWPVQRQPRAIPSPNCTAGWAVTLGKAVGHEQL